MMRRGNPVPVRVRGRVGDDLLDARGTLAFLADAVTVSLDGREIGLPYSALDGVTVDDGALVFARRDGAALRLDDLPDPHAAEALALDLGQQVPEVTRGLRGFASVTGAPGSDHDVFFGPLIAARRAAHVAAGPDARREAFDARRLREALGAAAAALAGRRFPAPEDAGDRRALEAELDDLLAPAYRALDALAIAGTDVAMAPGAMRIRAWRGWCEALQRVFAAADGAWLAALPALADSRGAKGALWRRVLRRGGI